MMSPPYPLAPIFCTHSRAGGSSPSSGSGLYMKVGGLLCCFVLQTHHCQGSWHPLSSVKHPDKCFGHWKKAVWEPTAKHLSVFKWGITILREASWSERSRLCRQTSGGWGLQWISAMISVGICCLGSKRSRWAEFEIFQLQEAIE